MIVAGIGFSSNASAEDILGAIDAACSVQGIDPSAIGKVATLAAKADAEAVRSACSSRQFELVTPDAETLDARKDEALTQSEASLREHGLGSVSEVCALAAAGPAGELLGPRVIVGEATCALAGAQPR